MKNKLALIFAFTGLLTFSACAQNAETGPVVNVTWEHPDAQKHNVTGYHVKWGTSPGAWSNAMNVTTEHQRHAKILGLTPGKMYYFVVTARNEKGESQPSTEFTFTVPEAPASSVPSPPIHVRVFVGDMDTQRTMKTR